MRLVVDTNILVRCSRGNASRHVSELLLRGVTLVTTDHNVEELIGVLMSVFSMDEDDAVADALHVVQLMRLVFADEYEPFADAARQRLHVGGQSDWPVLAASLADKMDIWSQDTDFFGTGVAVWSTHNVQHIEAGGDV